MIRMSLKAARVNANMTQADAANVASVCKTTIVSWEKGKTTPTIAQLNRLCDAYGVPVDVIFFAR